MMYGLYLSAQGAEAQSFRQAVVANNMANVGTSSFKRDFAVLRSHLPFDVVHGPENQVPETLLEQTGGLSVEGTVTDFSQGPLRQTGSSFDIALVGDGFFQVTDGNATFLTRDGHLALDSQNALVMADTGYAVLNATGEAFAIPPNYSGLSIGPEGIVSAVTAEGVRAPLGQLGLVQPAVSTDLIKEGRNLYRSLGDVEPALDAQVRQQFLEESGVNPLEETVTLIETNRAFEMNMNMIQMQDDMLMRLLQSATPA
jgi:flagellar basal body rod protein FlgG